MIFMADENMRVVYLIKHKCTECGHLDRVVEIDKCTYKFRCPKCCSTRWSEGLVFPVKKEDLGSQKVFERYASCGYEDAEGMAKEYVDAARKALEEVIEILGYNPLDGKGDSDGKEHARA